MTMNVNIIAQDNDDDLEKFPRSKLCTFETGSIQALVVAPLSYNPLTGKYEWSTRPSISIDDLTVSMGDVEKLLAENYWKQTRFDWTSGDLDYKGFNLVADASVDATDWYIWKYTWSGGSPTIIQGPLIGTWTGRAALSW